MEIALSAHKTGQQRGGWEWGMGSRQKDNRRSGNRCRTAVSRYGSMREKGGKRKGQSETERKDKAEEEEKEKECA